MKPTFLIRGPQGSGKRELVGIMSERMGLHLLDVDLAEMQALMPAQSENKFRTLLLNARKSVPCILYLNNIQVR